MVSIFIYDLWFLCLEVFNIIKTTTGHVFEPFLRLRKVLKLSSVISSKCYFRKVSQHMIVPKHNSWLFLSQILSWPCCYWLDEIVNSDCKYRIYRLLLPIYQSCFMWLLKNLFTLFVQGALVEPDAPNILLTSLLWLFTKMFRCQILIYLTLWTCIIFL